MAGFMSVLAKLICEVLVLMVDQSLSWAQQLLVRDVVKHARYGLALA